MSQGYGESAGHSGHGSGHGTWSVCPVCLQRIPAQRARQGQDVYLRKHCPEHGSFATIIWRGQEPRFADWVRPKTPSGPQQPRTSADKGCPHSCGLCAGHKQRTCTALLEVSQRCGLQCPVCFADAGNQQPDPDLDTVAFWYEQVLQTSGPSNIQLSGGEPTQRDDLDRIIGLGRDAGFSFVQLNTNGLRLAREPGYAQHLRDAGLDSVFLQFDGVSEGVYERLRGAPLWRDKQLVVEACCRAGLGVVLVPTLVPGVNVREVGDILRFALSAGPQVRGVHFQPISYFGRFPSPPRDQDRLTLPEVMRAVQEQTQGLVPLGSFQPPGCEHSLCSFHGNYLRTPGGGLQPLSQSNISKSACCSQPESAEQGALRSIDYTAKQWAGAGIESEARSTTARDFDGLLNQLTTWRFSISGMAFQDAWNLDLERLQGCCIHVVAPDGRLVPFCAYNLSAASGRTLYRGVVPA